MALSHRFIVPASPRRRSLSPAPLLRSVTEKRCTNTSRTEFTERIPKHEHFERMSRDRITCGLESSNGEKRKQINKTKQNPQINPGTEPPRPQTLLTDEHSKMVGYERVKLAARDFWKMSSIGMKGCSETPVCS